MNELSRHIGCRIRQFRKMQGLTLQQMADQLKKSKATMSKYESGDIILDVETLSSIADLLQVGINQLTDFRPAEAILLGADADCCSGDFYNPEDAVVSSDETSSSKPGVPKKPGQSSFFQADCLYFYYYDGRYRRLKSGIIRIHRTGSAMCHPATVVISTGTPLGRQSEEFYTGTVSYSDMLLRIAFTNQHSSMEENLLYLFNPPEAEGETVLAEGLLSGISTSDQVPCAFKCVVSLSPQNTDLTGPLMQHLAFTRRELQRLQKLNMLLADSQF